MAVAYGQEFQPKIRFEWISEAWQLFLAKAGTWIAAILIVGIIQVGLTFGLVFALGLSSLMFPSLSGAGAGTFPSPSTSPFAIYENPLYWVMQVIVYVVQVFFVGGLQKMAIAQVRGEQINMGMVFQGGTLFLRMLPYAFVFQLLSLLSALACLLPMFVVQMLLAPGFALIADGESFNDAFSRSFNTVKKDWLQAGLFGLSMLLIYLLSALACGIGLFATLPMILLIPSLMYRDMIGMPAGDSPQAPINPYGASQPGVWPPPPGMNQTSAPYLPHLGIGPKPDSYPNPPVPPAPPMPSAYQPQSMPESQDNQPNAGDSSQPGSS